jgi:uncharacterized protein YrrD
MMHPSGVMLRSFNDLRRFTISATDGNLGSVRDGYVDRRNWTVPSLIVQSPELPARRKLVPPVTLQSSGSNPSLHRVGLTTKEIADDTGAGETEAPHLQALTSLIGNTVESEEGEIGHVDDVLVDDRTWAIRYLVVNAEKWCPGKTVLVSPEWLIPVTRDGSNTLFSVMIALPEEPAPSGLSPRRGTGRSPGRVEALSDSTRPCRFVAAPAPCRSSA